MLNTKQTATLHSATCLLNALFREWSDHSLIDAPGGPQIQIPLGNDGALRIPLRRYSRLGRHQYMGNFLLEKNGVNHDTSSEIEFETFLDLLLDALMNALADRFKTDSDQTKLFKNRVLRSLHNIRLALETRSEAIHKLESCEFSFRETEQGLVIGHNFHPTPKSRDEFDDRDTLEFSPEFGAKFKLLWFMAAPSIVHQKRADSFQERDWTEELARQDLDMNMNTDKIMGMGTTTDQRMIPIPMHPWQWRVLRKNPLISEYINNGDLIFLGESRPFWHPTSSLRSLYRDESPYMLKFSMSVKLTNSVRHLLTREADRGLQLRDVLASPVGAGFVAENPTFKIITEPAYLCLKDKDGNPMAESIVVCRENPFIGANAENKIVLATLAQDAPLGGKNLIQHLIQGMDSSESLRQRCREWFKEFLNVAVKPPILAQANYGFLLGAHQQNLILEIRDGWPVAAYFRDCQGTGYSEQGYANFSGDVPAIARDNGNVLNEKAGNHIFSYHLIINSTFNVIAALCSSGWIGEEELVSDLRSFLEDIHSRGVKDESCLNYLLDEPTLMHKGNFLCALTGLNENTSENPLSIYTPIENPLSTRKEKGRIHADP